MLPLSLLTAAQGKPMLVELKNGETFNGHLEKCDNYMNLLLKHVVQTMPDGEHFFELKECYIRGNNIKYVRLQEDVLEAAAKQQQQQNAERAARGAFRGARRSSRGGPQGRGGRGRGRGGSARGGRGGTSDHSSHERGQFRSGAVYKQV